jgi:hypothetical protein
VQEFGCWTADLKRMAVWLNTCRIDTVAMQATGVDYTPRFEGGKHLAVSKAY